MCASINNVHLFQKIMRIPPAIVTGHFVLVAVAILVAVLALSLWLFVITTNRGQMEQMRPQTAAVEAKEKV
jgi:hypothetical protein